MKRLLKISLVLLFIVVVGITLTTATSNDKLPPKDEVTNFVTEMKGSSASTIFEKVKSNHPTWNADLLTCSTCSGDKEAVALYYTDSGPKGYGSIYFKDGEIVSPGSLKGYALKESYKGELTEATNKTEENVSTQPEEKENVIKVDDKNEDSTYTYENFENVLDKYDGNYTYSGDNIQALNNHFLKLGWKAEIKYCVAVNTSDKGTMYVVFGD